MKRKWLAVGIILSCIGTTVIPSTAQNSEKLSSASKDHWLYVGGSGPGNYSRIQDAIDNASENDTVFVYHDSSPYYENIIINITLTLLGENPTTTQIDGGSCTHTVTITSPHTIVSGFTITQPKTTRENAIVPEYIPEAANIYLNTYGSSIIGNTIRDGVDGVYCHHCHDITINNSTFFDFVHTGIFLDYVTNSTFENNTFNDCHEGAWGTGTCHDYRVIHNTFSHCNTGVGIQGNRSVYRYNKFYDSGNGVCSEGMYDDIEYNIFIKSDVLFWASLGVFAHNTVQDCSIGIDVAGNFATISDNTIQNCSTGVYVNHVVHTMFNHNNFINNHLDATFQNALLRWKGNYWGRPLFRPKLIPGFFSCWYLAVPWIYIDWHPAKQPYDIPRIL